MSKDKTFDLLIIFESEPNKIISGVTGYKYIEDCGLFAFDKDGWRSFLPKENVIFFGRRRDWEDNSI